MCAEKQAVTVAEMARMVGLSRARFYQLVGSAFPHPLYDIATRRPYYTLELQEACLEVRQRNLGVDGKPILFHQRRHEVARMRPGRSKRKAMPSNDSRYKDLINGLKSLGMAGVTATQVQSALKELHISDMDKEQGAVLRAVFLHLKKGQDTSAPTKKPHKE